ncbi:hypothetical protein VCUG_00834 [Vavraia culicis subsp. floridensis]|uniref:Uncharacterized protein n=1 Tax=Vavraia culicis (isolate floridensis) TaxID=948595 RepID=L2GWF5_VAVCU|nr:uncharacterized protein VCUG_00834 [Vavraia culicis subsp. floridensis]ELA47633.1 hypothetical protein VCUG_00834 [Vavraia culicis subsp. floridensis]
MLTLLSKVCIAQILVKYNSVAPHVLDSTISIGSLRLVCSFNNTSVACSWHAVIFVEELASFVDQSQLVFHHSISAVEPFGNKVPNRAVSDSRSAVVSVNAPRGKACECILSITACISFSSAKSSACAINLPILIY